MNESVHFFLIVSFWLNIARLINKGLLMSVADYPRITKWSVGEDAFSLIIAAGWLFWIAWLLWGTR